MARLPHLGREPWVGPYNRQAALGISGAVGLFARKEGRTNASGPAKDRQGLVSRAEKTRSIPQGLKPLSRGGVGLPGMNPRPTADGSDMSLEQD
jgi:hypothetical protein